MLTHFLDSLFHNSCTQTFMVKKMIIKNRSLYIPIILLNFISHYAKASENLDTTFSPNNTGIVTLQVNVESVINKIKIQSDGKIVTAGYSTNGNGNFNTLARYNTGGGIDTSFGTSGQVVNLVASNSKINDIAIQTDGKIVAGGISSSGTVNSFTLTRYTTTGALDSSFGSSGSVTTTINDNAFVQSIAIQTDGKIVAAGNSIINKQPNFTLARYNTNGTLDTTFNGTGIVTLIIGQQSAINSVAIQSDGKIVVGGYATDSNFTNQFTVARYNTNGSLDTSFGNNGVTITTTGLISTINSVAIQSDGKILASGFTGNNPQMLLVRYNSNGSIDSSFGTSGSVITNLGDTSYSNAISIQSDGKIVSAGNAFRNEVNNFGITRYNTNGSVDTSFGNNGSMVIAIKNGAEPNSVAIQSDGQILAAGYTICGQFNKPEFALIRVNKSNNQYITLNSLVNNSVINTRRPNVQGTSSTSRVTAKILIDGVFFATGTTSTTGAWNLGQTNILTGGLHVIEADLLLTGNKVAGSARQITVNATDSITITSPANNTMAPNNHPTVSGGSTLANTAVLLYLDGKYFNYVTTDSNGNWSAGATAGLAGGNHSIIVFLVTSSGNTIATAISKFTV